MEFFTILFSTLIGLISPAGFITDHVAESAIRKQLKGVEQLQIRIDNTPSYQLLNGRIEHVRIAGRGLFPEKEMRIALLEVETDPIALDAQRIRKGKFRLKQPLQAAIKVALTEADINQALRSPIIAKRFRKLGIDLLKGTDAEGIKRYNLINPTVDFLGNNRLRLQVELQERGYPDRLMILTEATLKLERGRYIVLVEPIVEVNGEKVPARLVKSIAQGVSDRLDLNRWAKGKILARILQLELTTDQLNLAAFTRIEP
ncbi:MAG: DUF2993 domain-containing protein [Scytolyngbya sp. HA4215-MV1]|jgi:hypothetical protein|nr:DUF2993 domain-containing protein [Scytolyngbya sp. HA4215-MV1]